MKKIQKVLIGIIFVWLLFGIYDKSSMAASCIVSAYDSPSPGCSVLIWNCTKSQLTLNPAGYWYTDSPTCYDDCRCPESRYKNPATCFIPYVVCIDNDAGNVTCEYREPTGPPVNIGGGTLPLTLYPCDSGGGGGSEPTLTATLMANPSSGNAPLTSSLTTTVGGTATGTITYSLHNCGGGIISGVSEGSFNCTYSSAGNYNPSIAVDRQGLNTSASTTVTVNPAPTLAVTLTANPPSGTAPLTSNLSTIVGGTATGAITYSGHSCGGGIISSISLGTFNCTYSSAGTYTASVSVTRQDLTTTATTNITVNCIPSSYFCVWFPADTCDSGNCGKIITTDVASCIDNCGNVSALLNCGASCKDKTATCPSCGTHWKEVAP